MRSASRPLPSASAIRTYTVERYPKVRSSSIGKQLPPLSRVPASLLCRACGQISSPPLCAPPPAHRRPHASLTACACSLASPQFFSLHPIPFCGGFLETPCTPTASSRSLFFYALACVPLAALGKHLAESKFKSSPLAGIIPTMMGYFVGWAVGSAFMQLLLEMEGDHPGLCAGLGGCTMLNVGFSVGVLCGARSRRHSGRPRPLAISAAALARSPPLTLLPLCVRSRGPQSARRSSSACSHTLNRLILARESSLISSRIGLRTFGHSSHAAPRPPR